ncbi:hypothetical protein K4F52_005477 [Lecanicillium sp. MT-2017a]|nr:hypothetical protein K4F52_005477 [Lecanicillium sp. MT-2017a]
MGNIANWVVDLNSFDEAQKVLDEKGLVVLFFLVSMPGAGTSYIGRSHYFNVTDPKREPTTTLPTSTVASTTTISTGTPASISPTQAATEPSVTPNASAADKSPSAVVIGGAVGGSLGALLILGSLALLAWWIFSGNGSQTV